jgi:tetratricopeptide (TPR) repeat protein
VSGARASPSADALLQRAAEAFRAGRFADAEAFFRQLLANGPHPGLLANLGLALAAQARFAEAAATLEQSLAVRPGNLNVLVALSSALAHCDRPAEALAHCDAGLAIDSRHVDLRHNRAVALGALNRQREALAVLRELLAEFPGDADAEFKIAVNELALREFGEGWRHYEARWRGARAHPPLPFAHIPMWSPGTPVQGRSVLAMAEQGLGDTLHFMRWVPRLAELARAVELQVQAPLVALVRRNLPGLGVEAVGAAPQARAELRLPLMSLPLALGLDEESDRAADPYVSADENRVAAWRDRLGEARGKRVAIAWRGSATLRRDSTRSIALERLQGTLAELARRGVEVLALQRDATEAERAMLARIRGVRDLGSGLDDFEDTAALLASADHVVSVDTALIHLAGAMGRPATLLLQFSGDFRWGVDAGRSVLYRSVRVLRQPAPGDWDPVLAAAARQASP